MLRLCRLLLLFRGDEQYAGVYVHHAAVHHFHVARSALHQQARGAKPAGPQGVLEDAVNRDSTIQSDVKQFCLQVPCQPFGRPSVHCSIRPDDVSYCPNCQDRSASSVRMT
jgi:uncharacterized Zn-finger protein